MVIQKLLSHLHRSAGRHLSEITQCPRADYTFLLQGTSSPSCSPSPAVTVSVLLVLDPQPLTWWALGSAQSVCSEGNKKRRRSWEEDRPELMMGNLYLAPICPLLQAPHLSAQVTLPAVMLQLAVDPKATDCLTRDLTAPRWHSLFPQYY